MISASQTRQPGPPDGLYVPFTRRWPNEPVIGSATTRRGRATCSDTFATPRSSLPSCCWSPRPAVRPPIRARARARARLAAAEPRAVRCRAGPPRREPRRNARRGRCEDHLRARPLRSRPLPHSDERRHATSREGAPFDRAFRGEGRPDRAARDRAAYSGDPDAGWRGLTM